MADLGAPASYLTLADGMPVFGADGDEAGTVEHMLADEEKDIFDGLVLDTPHGRRFADASLCGQIYERGAVLTIPSAQVASLPEPSANPAVMEADPDDTTPDGLADKLRRAWDLVSGNY